MPNKHTKESIEKELKRIQDSVPACYREGMLKEVPAFGAMKEVLERAMFSNASEEKKAMWREMLQDELLNSVEVIEDPVKVKKYNQWEDKQIRESIKAGRLPSKAQLKKLNIMYEDKINRT